MFLKQIFDWYFFGKRSVVPETDFVFVNTDLNRRGGKIIFVDHGIQKQLTKRRFREKEGFLSVEVIIGNESFHVFCVNKLHCFFDLKNQRAVYLVLIENVCIIFKIGDFDICACYPSFRVGMERKHTGTGQVVTFRNVQILNESFVCHI